MQKKTHFIVSEMTTLMYGYGCDQSIQLFQPVMLRL